MFCLKLELTEVIAVASEGSSSTCILQKISSYDLVENDCDPVLTENRILETISKDQLLSTSQIRCSLLREGNQLPSKVKT